MRHLLIVLALAAPVGARAQAPRTLEPSNRLFAEVLGSGGLYSLNYERGVGKHIAARVGLTVVPPMEGFTTFVAVPLSTSYLIGRGSHHAELGASALVRLAGRDLQPQPFGRTPQEPLVYPGLIVGYRYQRPGGGVFYRATFTPLRDAEGWMPSFGVSVGKAF